MGNLVDVMRRYSNLAIPLEQARKLAARVGHLERTEQPTGQRRPYRIAQRLDEATIQQLVQDYRDGIPTTRLTMRYGLGKGTVLKLLRERSGDGATSPRARPVTHGDR